MSVPTLAEYKHANPHRLEGGLRVKGTGSTNSTPPMISVVTVVYNGEKTLEKTIQSVLAQTYNNVEYIIIDGCSTDRTLDIVRSYESKIAYWLSEPDRGIYDAMNKGIALATGTWIHLLNADDQYYSQSALEEAVGTLDQNRTNYFTLVCEFANGEQKQQKFIYQAWKLFILPRLPHPALIVARGQYEQIGLYNPSWRVAADCDLILRLLNQYPAQFTDIAFVTMSQEGFGMKNIELGFQEYRDITIQNKFPAVLAWLVYYIKLLRWKLKAKRINV